MRLKIQKDVLIYLTFFRQVLSVGKDQLTSLKIKYDFSIAVTSCNSNLLTIICCSIEIVALLYPNYVFIKFDLNILDSSDC